MDRKCVQQQFNNQDSDPKVYLLGTHWAQFAISIENDILIAKLPNSSCWWDGVDCLTSDS